VTSADFIAFVSGSLLQNYFLNGSADLAMYLSWLIGAVAAVFFTRYQFVFISVGVCIRMNAHLFVQTYEYKYVNIFIFMQTCVYICKYLYANIYVHTNTPTQTYVRIPQETIHRRTHMQVTQQNLQRRIMKHLYMCIHVHAQKISHLYVHSILTQWKEIDTPSTFRVLAMGWI